MASALALGDGLRLRSRRVRSGRSHRLSLWLAIVVIAAAGGAGFVGVQVRTPAQPTANVFVVDAATLDQQRFVSQVRPIHAEIQGGIAETGLVVASYQSGSIGKPELQRRLAAVLASYRDAASQLDAVDAPAPMRSTVQGYRETLATLTQLGTELSKAYDDGDAGRVSATLALSLQATAQWHDLGDPGGAPSARS
jgi:hypothetical protein